MLTITEYPGTGTQFVSDKGEAFHTFIWAKGTFFCTATLCMYYRDCLSPRKCECTCANKYIDEITLWLL